MKDLVFLTAAAWLAVVGYYFGCRFIQGVIHFLAYRALHSHNIATDAARSQNGQEGVRPGIA